MGGTIWATHIYTIYTIYNIVIIIDRFILRGVYIWCYD